MSRKRRRLTTEEILAISNDISEDMCRAPAWQLIQVVEYFRNEFDRLWQHVLSDRLTLGTELLKMGTNLLKPPEVKAKPESKAGDNGLPDLTVPGAADLIDRKATGLRCIMGKDGKTWNLFEELGPNDCGSTDDVREVQVRRLESPGQFLKVQVPMCAKCRKKWQGKWRYFRRPPFVPSD